MGYNKVIVIAEHSLEIFQYEKEFIPRPRNVRPYQDVLSSSLLAVGGENTSQQIKAGKRRDNARRARVAFGRLVRANLRGMENPILFTFTYRENETSLSKCYRDFSSFIQALRYRFSKTFRYICVPEFQKRGAVHFHALFWGLPSSLVFSERQTRFFASIWGLGFIFLKETDGHARLSHYLAKYMSKAYLDPRLFNQKAYVASRNIFRPQIYSNVPVWPFLDDYGLVSSLPLQEKEYSTKYLGKGRYRSFNLSTK